MHAELARDEAQRLRRPVRHVAEVPHVPDVAHRDVVADVRTRDDDALVLHVGEQGLEVGARVGEVLEDLRGDDDVERVVRQPAGVDELRVFAQFDEVADCNPSDPRQLLDVVVVDALAGAVYQNLNGRRRPRGRTQQAARATTYAVDW